MERENRKEKRSRLGRNGEEETDVADCEPLIGTDGHSWELRNSRPARRASPAFLDDSAQKDAKGTKERLCGLCDLL